MEELLIHNQWTKEMGISQLWEKKVDGWWVFVPFLHTLEMAKIMRSAGSRLITITAIHENTGNTHLAYHWDLAGEIFTWVCSAEDNIFVSICEVCPGADWVEREIRDYYAVTFLGQSEHNPLMLRAHDPAGVFLPVEKEVI